MQNKRSNITRRSALRLLGLAGIAALAPTIAVATPEEDLAKTESNLADAQARLADAEVQLDAIAAEYEALSQEQSQTLDDLDAVRKDIAQVSAHVTQLEEHLSHAQQDLATSVAEEYKDGNHGVVDLILGSTTIEELLSNFYYYDKVVEEKARLIDDVKATKADLLSERDELEQRQVSLEEISQLQAEQLAAMRDKQYEAQLVIESLDDEVRELIAQRDAEILAAQQEAERARQEREAAERAAAEKAAAEKAAAEQAAQQEAERATAQMAAEEAAAAAPAEEPHPAEAAPAPPAEEPAEPAEEAPAEEATPTVGSAAAVVAACHSTPSPGAGLCAGWCSDVMVNAGYGFVPGNANDMYAAFCFSSNRADLMPGMAVAVSTHPQSTAGRIYGHIGMYIGGGMMMDNIGYIRTISVDEWCAYYGETVSPRWGWLNGIVLQ